MLALGRCFRLSSLLLTAACVKPQSAPDTSAADRAAIDAGHEAFLAGMRANDCHALLALLTADVVFVPPNMPQANGPDRVRSWCESTFAQVKTKSVVISSRDVTVAGDWGIEHATFEWTVVPAGGGGDLRDEGRVVAIWRRQPDGSWKLARDIWNSALPLPAPAAAR